MISSTANRGKWAEGKVQEYLKALELADAGFTFNRIYDSHSARAVAFAPQAGDYQAFRLQNGVAENFLLEVKEVAHAFRLNYNNFKPDQVARMRKRLMAGSICWVLVAHSQQKVWRCVPLSFFIIRDVSVGSWNLTEFPEDSLKHHLDRSLTCQVKSSQT